MLGLTCAVDDVYEEPTDADLVVDLTKQSIPEIVHCKHSSCMLWSIILIVFNLAIVLLLESNGLL